MKKLKIFISFHDKLFFENYSKDKDFSEEHYTFLKIDKLPNNYTHLSNMLDINNFENFIDITTNFGEFQGLYNIYKNPKYYKDLDYFGYLQYDKLFVRIRTNETNITEQILNNLGENNHLSLETHSFSTDYNEKIMMDETRPTELQGGGKNVYIGILEEYNKFYNTNYTLNDLHGRLINLCTCFVIPIRIFEKIMPFICSVIESKRLEKYFPASRVHGAGLGERYMAVSLALEPNLNFIDLNIFHLNQK